MQKPNFESVVTRLREQFLATNPKGEAGKLSRELNALPLDVVDWLKFFLHPDCRMLAFNLFVDEVTAEFTETRDVAFGLRLGSKHFPELADLLPDRPLQARDCTTCSDSGWVTDKDQSKFACGACHGCGWFESTNHE